MLYLINTTVWKYLFGKPADSLQKSTDNEDECRFLFDWNGVSRDAGKAGNDNW
jgi:hypothetical protein